MFDFNSNLDYIVVGLGNIGSDYEMTRHNMGFMVLDNIAQNYNFGFNKDKFQAKIVKQNIFDKNVLFMKPSTYMNNSGLAVLEAINFYKIQINKLVVVYDDITLDLGKIKIKNQGSDGGHNGIKSILQLTDQENFARIKVGISKKPNKEYKLADWVLSKFSLQEFDDLKKGIDLASKALETIIKYGVDAAMNEFNKKN